MVIHDFGRWWLTGGLSEIGVRDVSVCWLESFVAVEKAAGFESAPDSRRWRR